MTEIVGKSCAFFCAKFGTKKQRQLRNTKETQKMVQKIYTYNSNFWFNSKFWTETYEEMAQKVEFRPVY